MRLPKNWMPITQKHTSNMTSFHLLNKLDPSDLHFTMTLSRNVDFSMILLPVVKYRSTIMCHETATHQMISSDDNLCKPCPKFETNEATEIIHENKIHFRLTKPHCLKKTLTLNLRVDNFTFFRSLGVFLCK